MKRLLICDNSGYANYSVFLCNAMLQEQCQFSVYYLTEKDNKYLDQLSVGVELSTNLYVGDKTLKRKSFQWYMNRILGWIRVINSKWSEIKRINPDVIIFQALAPVYDQYLLPLYKKRAKIIFTVHNVIPHEKTIYWSMKSLKRVYDLCDHLVVHTEENKAELMEKFSIKGEKITVINHGISLDYVPVNVEEEKRKFGIADNKPILLAYGGIRDYKGTDILVNACRGIDCHLIIAGAVIGDTDFESVKKAIIEKNISAICIDRFITNEESNVLFQIADYIVLPYKEFHSQSGVFMQAIQYTKPVIATDVASFKKFVDQYHLGYICIPGSEESLHDTIIEALENRADVERIGQIREKFSWANSAREYEKTIGSLLQG